jgi:2-hydroxy-3-keto-5-methylthiopentenyl-1-phosphate phosphatase
MRSSRWISASTSPLLVLPTTCCWYVRLTLHRSYTASRRLYSSKQVDVAFENECCKHIFQLFQMFQMYVASVSYGCCKSRSECIICCNECTHILQACSKCLICFLKRTLQVYLSRRCICFTHMLHMFFNGFSSVFRCFCQCFRRIF